MPLPPGPSSSPAVQTLRWVTRPVPLMQSSRLRYGDLFTIRLAQVGTFVFVSDPALVKQVMTADPDLLHAGAAAANLAPVLGERSVLLLDEPEHMRQRKLLLPAFHGERMKRYAQLIAQITDDAVDRWPLGQEFSLDEQFRAVTLEIILRAVFGVDDPARLEELAAAITRMLSIARSPMTLLPWLRRDLGPLTPWRRFVRDREQLDRLLFAHIAQRRAAGGLDQRDDVLSMLLQAVDEDGHPMTDGELRDELMTLLVAGHETTATALAWAFERLFRTPEALARLTSEARGSEGSAYADATVQEILRLRPPIPIVARLTRGEYELGGYLLPAGVRIAPCISLIHTRADLYPEPFAFRPERFLESKPETYGWIPFGGGVRRCLGASFAQFEMTTVLQTVLARVTLRAAGPPEHVARRAIVLVPSSGGRAVLQQREPRGAPATEPQPVAA